MFDFESIYEPIIDGTYSVPAISIVNFPGVYLVRTEPGKQHTGLQKKLTRDLRAAAKQWGKQVHINTCSGHLLVTVSKPVETR